MAIDVATWLAGGCVLVAAAVVVLAIAVALYGAAICRRLDAILEHLDRRDT